MEADPVSRMTPHYYIDRWRAKHEVGRGLKLRGALCYPGRGGCNGYPHPHRKGSRFCEHNPKLTMEMLQERHESGGRS